MSNDFDYSYDEQAADKADAAASRITEGGAYVGTFKKVSRIVAKTGTEGMEFSFERPEGGSVSFSLYTRKQDGTKIAGSNFVSAMMFLFGLKSLKGVQGKVEQWDDDAKGRVETDGIVYPDLYDRPIGIVLQKELVSKANGADSYRFNLEGLFQPETRLTVTEIKERKVKPEKLDKILKALKVKDTRKKQADEPAQPAMGVTGDY